MSHRALREKLAIERQLLWRLLEEHRQLIGACGTRAPSAVERAALGAVLQSFYNGVENVFKCVAVEFGEKIPAGAASHRDLLDSMAAPGPQRPRVISDAMRDRLDRYLDFRHLFRHGYTFDLRWEKMAAAVQQCEEAMRQFDSELKVFVDSLDA